MRSAVLWRRVSILGVIAAASLPIIEACTKDDLEISRRENRPECPGSDTVVAIPDTISDRVAITGYTSVLAVPGSRTLVPEYHDCQAFEASTPPQKSPLYAIFAFSGLDTSFANQATTGTQPSPTTIGPTRTGATSTVGGTQPIPPKVIDTAAVSTTTAPVAGVAYIVAEILSYGGTYAPLAIRPGFNCLYLFQRGRWGAVILHVIAERDCLKPYDLSRTDGTVLQAMPSALSGFSSGDYPPVARWDRDSLGTFMIGIRCGAAWCTVGQNAARSSPSYGPGGAADARGKRVRQVKGWYDEQRLWSIDKGQWAHPTDIVGTLFPDPALDGRPVSDFEVPGGVLVAQVAMSRDDSAYKKKLNFDKATPNEPMNKIYIRHVGSDLKTGWSATIVSARGDTRGNFNVYYRGHDIPISGMARWRWKWTDETVWVACPNGCCEVEAQ
jgi:hypothetical protein